jgi:hypothetical protein
MKVMHFLNCFALQKAAKSSKILIILRQFRCFQILMIQLPITGKQEAIFWEVKKRVHCSSAVLGTKIQKALHPKYTRLRTQ